jgi:hypothetical protein
MQIRMVCNTEATAATKKCQEEGMKKSRTCFLSFCGVGRGSLSALQGTVGQQEENFSRHQRALAYPTDKKLQIITSSTSIFPLTSAATSAVETSARAFLQRDMRQFPCQAIGPIRVSSPPYRAGLLRLSGSLRRVCFLLVPLSISLQTSIGSEELQ